MKVNQELRYIKTMARKRKTWKQAVETKSGYAEWTFGSSPRDVNKDPGKRVSEALKAVNKWDRRSKAQKFAKRMWDNYYRVRDEGCANWRLGGQKSLIPNSVIVAMSWGVGDGHRRVMMERYKKAAQAAERFCRR